MHEGKNKAELLTAVFLQKSSKAVCTWGIVCFRTSSLLLPEKSRCLLIRRSSYYINVSLYVPSSILHYDGDG